MPLIAAQLIWVVCVLLVVGVLLWGLNQIPGIDGTIKSVARTIIIVVVAIYLIYFLAELATSLPALPGRH